jgi:hypothetical protein
MSADAMTKQELLDKLYALRRDPCVNRYEGDGYYLAGHLLLEYLDDPDISHAYGVVNQAEDEPEHE